MRNLKHYILALLFATLSAFILTSCSGGGGGGGGTPAPADDTGDGSGGGDGNGGDGNGGDGNDGDGTPKDEIEVIPANAIRLQFTGNVTKTVSNIFGDGLSAQYTDLLQVTNGVCGVPGYKSATTGIARRIHGDSTSTFTAAQYLPIKVEFKRDGETEFTNQEYVAGEIGVLTRLSAIYPTKAEIPDFDHVIEDATVGNTKLKYENGKLAYEITDERTGADSIVKDGTVIRLTFEVDKFTYDGKTCYFGDKDGGNKTMTITASGS